MSSCPWAHLARWASCSSCPALCTSPAVCSRMASTLARLRTRVLISSARRWIWSGAAGSDSSSTRLATTSMLSGSAPSSAGGSSHCVPYSTPGWRGQADQRGTWDRAGGWGAEMAGGQRRVGAGQGPCSAAWGRGGTVHVQCRDNAVWHSAGSMQCGAGAEPQNPGQEWPALPACRHSRLRKALTLLISSLSSLLELSTRALVWFALSRAACACIRASFAFPLASAT